MHEHWFQQWTQRWTEGVPLTPAQEKKCAALLRQLATLQAGELVEDADIAEGQARAHVERRLEDLFHRWFGRYAAALRPASVPGWYAIAPEQGHGLTFVRGTQRQPRLNLNTATVEELIALPLVGRATARELVRARRQGGAFRAWPELDRVPGIGPALLELLGARCFLGPTADVTFSSPALEQFLRRPALDTYARLLLTSGGVCLPAGRSPQPSVAACLLQELAALRDEVQADPYPPFALLGGTRAQRVRADSDRRQLAEEAAERSGNGHGCLLHDRDYHPFVARLLDAAQQSIDLMLFYLKIEPQHDYPVNSLLEQLIERHRQGATVRVLLDRDRPTDVYRAEEINSPAVEALRQAGVPVRQDARERLTHAKLLVVDGRHLVLGSHNWTAGSLCWYDDTSLYLDAAAVAEEYTRFFQACWEAAPSEDKEGQSRTALV